MWLLEMYWRGVAERFGVAELTSVYEGEEGGGDVRAPAHD
jgi:hypothetical protein